MGKVLLWVIVILGVMLATRILTRFHDASQRKQTGRQPAGSSATASADPEPMVRCAHCSIHIPRSEAVLSGGKTWCCVEHAKLGPGA